MNSIQLVDKIVDELEHLLKKHPTQDTLDNIANMIDEHTQGFDRTLTEKQLADPRYLDWDDQTLGRCVRHIAQQMKDDESLKPIIVVSASTIMTNIAIVANADKLIHELTNVHGKDGISHGDWKVTIQKMKGGKRGK